MYSALSIAPNNPVSSNSVQTDLRIFTAHGVRGSSIVSAIPYQFNSDSGQRIVNQAMSHGFITHQIDIAMENHQIRTWKIGELADKSTISEVVSSIRKHQISSVIFNPVLSNADNETYSNDVIDTLVLDLLPLSQLVVLTKQTALQLLESEDELKPTRLIAQELHDLGANCVLIVDIPDSNSFEYVDIFFDGKATIEIRSPVIASDIKTGLVSTLSSSISAYIARGMQLEQAVQSGREYLTVVLASTESDINHVKTFGLNHTLNRMMIDEPTNISTPSGNATEEMEDLSKYIDMIEDETVD